MNKCLLQFDDMTEDRSISQMDGGFDYVEDPQVPWPEMKIKAHVKKEKNPIQTQTV